MKNFLKSTALFACIAMMFCACSEDSTEDTDVGGAEVVISAPSVTEVTPGVSNIYVEWSVLKGCTADQTLVTWVNNDDAEIYGSHTEEIIPNKSYYTVIRVTTDADEVESVIAAGTYTVTITNLISSTGETSTVEERVVTVYDDSTYADYCPEPVDITYDVDRGEATIIWGEVHEDCVSVTITYNTTTTLEVLDIATGDQTVLVDAIAEGAYSYVATFRPEGCEDEVYISSVEDLVLGTNPEAPTWVSANAGNGRFLIRWTYAEGDLENLQSSVITYTSIVEDSAANSITVDKADLEINEESEYYCYVNSVMAGEYVVSVSNIKVGGFISGATTATANVVVYDSGTFTPPTFSSIEVDNNTGYMNITWAGTTEELKKVVVEYYDSEGSVREGISEITSDIITTTSLIDAKVGSNLISATAYMRYTNGLDLVEYEIAMDENVTIPAGATPVITTVSRGYADGASTITVDWLLASTSGYESIKVYYGLVSENISTYKSSEALALDATSYTITGLDVADYKIYVSTIAEDVPYNCIYPATITTYGVDTYADYVTPIPTLVTADDKVTVSWSVDGVSDLYSVIYSYADGSDDDVVVMAADIATPTSFAYKANETVELTYTVQFQPEDGAGAVTITPADSVVAIPEQAPDAPVALTADSFGYNASGVSYINVSWSAPSDASDIAKYYLYYSTDGNFPGGDGIEITGTSYEFSSITPLGEYTIFVKSSTAAGTQSLDYASITVLAYNASYFTEADLPTATAVSINGVVTIEWSNVSKYLESVDINYGGSVVSHNFSEGSSTVFNLNESATAEFTYTANFVVPGGTGSCNTLSSGSLSIDIVTSDVRYDSVNDVYEIYSATGLAVFADIVNGTSTYLSSATVEGFDSTVAQNLGANATLMVSVDMSDVCGDNETSWTPMATYAAPYTGTFDGGGFSVQNLYISSTSQYSALFASISSASTLKDLTLDCATISGAANTAGFVGYLNGGRIENCHVTGSKTISATGANSGSIAGYSNAGTIVNCTSDADFDTTAQYTGGIVGRNEKGYVVNCHLLSAGSVRSTTYRLGGITGYNTGYIIGSSNAGVVGASETSSSAGGTSGGIAGQDVGGYIIGCYNIGELSVTDSGTSAAIAGIVGNNSGTTSMYGCYSSSEMNLGGTSEARRGYLGGGDGTATAFTTYQSCYYIKTCTTLTLQGDPELADVEGQLEEVADVATISTNVANMNSAITAGISALESALSTTFGYTLSYAAGSGAPEITVDAK